MIKDTVSHPPCSACCFWLSPNCRIFDIAAGEMQGDFSCYKPIKMPDDVVTLDYDDLMREVRSFCDTTTAVSVEWSMPPLGFTRVHVVCRVYGNDDVLLREFAVRPQVEPPY